MTMLMRYAITLFFGFGFFLQTSHSVTHDLSPSIPDELLSESVPFTFPPSEMDSEDFKVSWAGTPVSDVNVSLKPGSLTWVRVSDVLVLPRGHLKIEMKSGDRGIVTHHQKSHLLSGDSDSPTLIPVALISGSQNKISIQIDRNGKTISGALVITYSPRDQFRNHADLRVLIDTTCSQKGIGVDTSEMTIDSWMYLGCRTVWMDGDDFPRSSFEIFVFMDNVGQEIRIDGIPVRSLQSSIWPLRVNSKPGNIELSSSALDRHSKVVIHYKVPERMRKGFLGMGIGPFHYRVSSQVDEISATIPLATLYASYFWRESLRTVAFNAFSGHRNWFNDFGLYMWVNQLVFLDKRFTWNLLFGAHVITYKYDGEVRSRISAPQGVEFGFRDFLNKGKNLNVGSFLYPSINDRSYYNLWLRWGGSIFYELNYIAWTEPVNDDKITNSSLGLTIGFPLLQFL